MSLKELNSLEEKLAQAPLDWELRLALIQAHVIRDQADEAKKLVRDSPDEAGPAPPQVQFRLHRLMTEGRSAAEEFAREDGQGEAVVAGESKDPSSTLIEVEVVSVGGGTPAVSARGVEDELSGSAEGLFGVIADGQPASSDSRPDTVEEDSVLPKVPASEVSGGENAMKVVDPSGQQRELDNSPFAIESVEEFLPLKRGRDSGRKVSALAFALLAHVVLIVLLGAIVMADSRPNPPQLVVVNVTDDQVLDVPRKRVERIKKSKALTASAQTTMVITSAALAPVTLLESDVSDVSFLPRSMVGFGNGFGNSGEGIGGGGRSGMIGGMKIKSRRLGVVLDVSGSMDQQIRAVRREIRKNFSSATVVEVVGCSLDWRGDDLNFDLKKAKGRVRFKKNADSVVEAVEILIVAVNVDAIFWFSDLMDSQTKAGQQRLSHLLGTQFGSERRPVKFYVQSVDREPTAALAGIAKRSGGATKVESFD